MLDDLEKETPQESVYLQMEQEQEQEQEQEVTTEVASEEVEELTSDTADSSDLLLHAAPLEIPYESMTLKDLQTLAKSRHITGVSTMKKGALVDALKASQADSLIEEIDA